MAQTQTLQLAPCALPGVQSALQCGTYTVPENRTARTGRPARTIALRVVLLPAVSETPERDPIVILQGGPGQSNVSTVAGFVNAPQRQKRSFLFIDLRGTGASHPIDCVFPSVDGARADFLPLEGVRSCRDSLSRVADLAQYTTPVVVEDLEDVFKALDVERVNLWGFSGGTRHALAFMRRYPARVRSVVMHGPVPIDARIPLTFASDAQEALDGVLDECLAESACARRFPDLRNDFRTVVRRLTQAPDSVRVRLGLIDAPLVVTRSAFAQVIRYMLYQPVATRLLPLVLHQAARGDYSLIADRIRTLGIPGGVSYGFYLSNTCAEDVPWFEMNDAVKRASGTYLGDYRVLQQRAACEGWPRGALPDGYLEPVKSDIPTLILVGERDPVTPPRWGREVVRHLSAGRLVVVPGGGHSFAGLLGQQCLDRLLEQFFENASAAEIDVGCVREVRRPPFALEEPDPRQR